MNHWLRAARCAVLAGLGFGLAVSVARAGDPDSSPNWKGSATGTNTPGTVPGVDVDDFSGHSSFLGWFTATGTHTLDPATGIFQGKATWKAASGDTLNVNFSGTVTVAATPNPVYPYGFTGVLLVNGGTGRLKHAKGSANWMGAFTGIPGKFFFSFEGNLSHAECVAPEGNFKLTGHVGFSNIQQGIQPNGLVPYLGYGKSELIGSVTETGTIRNLTGLIPVTPTTFMFLGEVGPHPTLPGNPLIHLITTDHGNIYTTWTALFTLQFVDAQGDAVFSGDGDFKVTGGTGAYKHASGRFQTLFATGTLPPGVNQASAGVAQQGTIHAH
jgi:hypothetical protein